MTNKMILADIITKAVLQSKRSIFDLGKETGIYYRSIYEWMEGKHSPNLMNLSKLCHALGITIQFNADGTICEIMKGEDSGE